MRKEPKKYKLSQEIVNRKEPNKIPMPSLKDCDLDEEKKENINSSNLDDCSSQEF